jgi:hypothetical protein
MTVQKLFIEMCFVFSQTGIRGAGTQKAAGCIEMQA